LLLIYLILYEDSSGNRVAKFVVNSGFEVGSTIDPNGGWQKDLYKNLYGVPSE
jgi:hypothetical protein